MEPTGRLQLKEVTRKTRPSEPDTATRAATDSSGERGHLPAPIFLCHDAVCIVRMHSTPAPRRGKIDLIFLFV
jgi:hypothetical protein